MSIEHSSTPDNVEPVEELARAIVNNCERGVEWRTRRSPGHIDVIAVVDGKQVDVLTREHVARHVPRESAGWVAEALAFGPTDIAGLLAIIDDLRVRLSESLARLDSLRPRGELIVQFEQGEWLGGACEESVEAAAHARAVERLGAIPVKRGR